MVENGDGGEFFFFYRPFLFQHLGRFCSFKGVVQFLGI